MRREIYGLLVKMWAIFSLECCLGVDPEREDEGCEDDEPQAVVLFDFELIDDYCDVKEREKVAVSAAQAVAATAAATATDAIADATIHLAGIAAMLREGEAAQVQQEQEPPRQEEREMTPRGAFSPTLASSIAVTASWLDETRSVAAESAGFGSEADSIEGSDEEEFKEALEDGDQEAESDEDQDDDRLRDEPYDWNKNAWVGKVGLLADLEREAKEGFDPYETFDTSCLVDSVNEEDEDEWEERQNLIDAEWDANLGKRIGLRGSYAYASFKFMRMAAGVGPGPADNHELALLNFVLVNLDKVAPLPPGDYTENPCSQA